MRLIKNSFKNSGLVAVIVAAMMVVGGGSAVAGSMITGKQIKNSTVTGADIKNGSLGSSDLNAAAKSTLQGPKGDQGAKGDTGNAGQIFSRSSGASQSASGLSFTNLAKGSLDVNVANGSSKLLINFSAECSVVDPNSLESLYARIAIDGVPTTIPADVALCTNTSSFSDALYVGASMQRVVDVAPGAHTVQVQFRTSDAEAAGRLDDTVLTVQAGN